MGGAVRQTRRALVFAGLALAALTSRRARADEAAEAPPKERAAPVPSPLAQKPGYAHLFATALAGTGFRFNNPYRLSTVLGSDAESVSRTAAYVDVGVGATFGDALGFQFGAALRSSFAVEGVRQAVLTPSFVAYRRWGAWAAMGRVGTPIVLQPDATWGLEAGLAGTWYFLGGIGLTAEVVGDVFYGTGTADVRVASYPVLSGQAGLTVSWEVLP